LLQRAGGDTTATALTAAFFYLSRYPSCYQKLAIEIRSTFKSGIEIQGGVKIAGCSYLRACIDESLRITPPTPTTLWRELRAGFDNEPLIIDGHIISSGTQVGVNTYSIHHNDAYFPDPFVFKPERWLADDAGTSEEAKKLARDAFAAFSLGCRGCAGKAMAYLEMNLVLAKTFWYMDFARPSDSRINRIGEGPEGQGGGRGGRVDFQVKEQFTSVHEGPNLVFRTN
jgi:cytochrome P450